nr:FecR domain-containing protein [Pedobacter sp. ASV19]
MREEILIRYVAKECTQAENTEVLAWIAQNPEHQKQLDALFFVWEQSKTMQHRTSIAPEDSLERLKQKVQQNRSDKGIRTLWLKAVAVVICICAVGLLGRHYYGATEILQAGSTESTTTATLVDGSVVTLNKNSLLDYPDRFKGNKRVVELKRGEAFFKVSPDKQKPFFIRANRVSIRVVGTSFNVKIKNETTEVIVETGKVMVTGQKETWTLVPGQKLLLSKNGTLLEDGKADQLYQYYRSHVFVAKNTPLWRMVEVLNEAYQADIIVPDKNLRQLPLNSTFRNDNLEDILSVIAQTFQLKIQRNGQQIRLIR